MKNTIKMTRNIEELKELVTGYDPITIYCCFKGLNFVEVGCYYDSFLERHTLIHDKVNFEIEEVLAWCEEPQIEIVGDVEVVPVRRQIELIKAFRIALGLGLKESKHWLEKNNWDLENAKSNYLSNKELKNGKL